MLICHHYFYVIWLQWCHGGNGWIFPCPDRRCCDNAWALNVSYMIVARLNEKMQVSYLSHNKMIFWLWVQFLKAKEVAERILSHVDFLLCEAKSYCVEPMKIPPSMAICFVKFTVNGLLCVMKIEELKMKLKEGMHIYNVLAFCIRLWTISQLQVPS